MKSKFVEKIPYEVKYLGAPSSHEYLSVKHMLDNIDKEQEWEKIAKKKYIFKYWIIYKGIDLFENVSSKFKNALYKISCFLKPRNKFTFKYLPNDYMDISDKIFFINFELLERFCEEENPFEYYDCYEESEIEYKHRLNEMRYLYHWWKKRDKKNFEISQEDREHLEQLIKISPYLWT
jgi:hypothetical protein